MWSILTLLFTCLPMIFSIVLTTIKGEWGRKQKEKYQLKTVNQIQDNFSIICITCM